MLVHICCSVDSHYFLQKLQSDYPNEKLIGFFYDPNIHPYSEYQLRLLDVKRSCNLLNIELIEGEYDTQGWLEAIKGLENEPEKGKRCSVCFDNRFEVSAKQAQLIGQQVFTSTLLTSPKKSLFQLQQSGNEIALRYNLQFIAPDYRSKQGTQEQNILAKKDQLYRQDYCGCLFALEKQREYQNKLADELFSPISNQILPESIEEKLQFYTKRLDFEEKNIPYRIQKERFLNFRLLYAKVTYATETIASHFLPYSTLKKGYSRGKISWMGDIGYFDRDEICFITLDYYNKISHKNYTNIQELIFAPPLFEDELKIREQIFPNRYNLSALIVVQEQIMTKCEIFCQSKVYEDTKEFFLFS